MLCRPPRYTLFPYTTLFRSLVGLATLPAAAVALWHDEEIKESFKKPEVVAGNFMILGAVLITTDVLGRRRDRKSTRLNSSHLGSSYAVFCLKIKSSCSKISE